MTRASFLHRSPLLLLTVALVALAVFFVHDSRPASAEHGGVTILSADLTVKVIGGGGARGCHISANVCTSALTDITFNHGGVSYTIRALFTDSGNALAIILDQTIPSSLKSDLTLYIDAIPFAAADATTVTTLNTNDTLQWTNSGVSWSVGDTVDVWLRVPAFTGVELFGGDLTVIDEHSAPTLTVAEGGSATFMVKLSEQPIANVTVSIGRGQIRCAGCGEVWHDDVNAGTISPTTMTFNFSNWDAGQTVTVTGVADDDSVHEHFQALVWVSSTTSTSSDDPFRSPDASSGVYVTVTDGTDTGTQHGGL